MAFNINLLNFEESLSFIFLKEMANKYIFVRIFEILSLE